MKFYRRLRQPAEIALTRLGEFTLPFLPRRLIVQAARLCGVAAYLTSGHLRRVGLANLDIVFGSHKTRAEKKDILRAAFCSFALMLFDIFWFSRRPEKRIPAYVHFDKTCAPLFRQTAQILITAHMGNWEILGQAISLRGLPLASVAAPLANPAVDKLMIATRQRTGQKIIPRSGALRGMLRTLRRGAKIGVLLDQNTKPSEGGVFVNFCGLPVPVSMAAATLSRGIPVELLFLLCLHTGSGHYHVSCPAQIKFTAQMEKVRRTQMIADKLCEIVNAYPRQWLWMYKRWKHVPPTHTRSAYPFYAKLLPPYEIKKNGARHAAAARPEAGNCK